MFIAKDETFQRVLRGSQINSQTVVQTNLVCPICEKDVEYNPAAGHPFKFFRHLSGSTDCFSSDGSSDQHRLAVEVTVGAIYNRLAEVVGDSVEIDIDIERWVGSPSKFVITDVRVSDPIQITAEVFYRAKDLELKRRINTLSTHDYRTFLIFHTGGIHNVNRIHQYMQQISSLSIGRFDSETMDIQLGDLFSTEHINFGGGDIVPNYMIYTR